MDRNQWHRKGLFLPLVMAVRANAPLPAWAIRLTCMKSTNRLKISSEKLNDRIEHSPQICHSVFDSIVRETAKEIRAGLDAPRGIRSQFSEVGDSTDGRITVIQAMPVHSHY